LYEHLLQKLRPGRSGWRLLEWLLCSTQPLTLRELEVAMAVRPHHSLETSLDYAFDIKRTALRLCGPFASYHEATETMNLVHGSVKDFFLKSHQANSENNPHIIEQDAQGRLFKTCMAYLCFKDIHWSPLDIISSFT